MTSRRIPATAPKTTASPTSAQLPHQIPKPASQPPPPPPSSSPPLFALKDLQDLLTENVKQTAEMFKNLESKMAQTTDQLEQKLQQKLAQTTDQVEQKTDQLIKQQQELLKKHEDFRVNMSTAFQGLVEYVDGVAERMDENEQKAELNEQRLEFVEENLEVVKNDVLISQYRDMEYAIRIRGLAEDAKENLREVISAAIADVLGCGQELIYDEIERVFRVNSWVARQRNLPRDVVVYFTRKMRRNEIMQLFYQQRFKILNQEVILLKEIPAKILRARRDYAFLAQELKNRQLIFRWDVPIGLIVTVAGKRYKINSVKKANDFLTSVLQAERPPTPQKSDVAEHLIVDLPSTSYAKESSRRTKETNGKEQRMTRAAHRRKEKEQQKVELASSEAPVTASEPVGGARPKVFVKSYASSIAIGLQLKNA